jgi:hypothetical protein
VKLQAQKLGNFSESIKNYHTISLYVRTYRLNISYFGYFNTIISILVNNFDFVYFPVIFFN